jgi:DNA repair exonuclease SbcCD ATPase subunit
MNYYNKYCKYKTKYLQLKYNNNQYGGVNTETQPNAQELDKQIEDLDKQIEELNKQIKKLTQEIDAADMKDTAYREQQTVQLTKLLETNQLELKQLNDEATAEIEKIEEFLKQSVDEISTALESSRVLFNENIASERDKALDKITHDSIDKLPDEIAQLKLQINAEKKKQIQQFPNKHDSDRKDLANKLEQIKQDTNAKKTYILNALDANKTKLKETHKVSIDTLSHNIDEHEKERSIKAAERQAELQKLTRALINLANLKRKTLTEKSTLPQAKLGINKPKQSVCIINSEGPHVSKEDCEADS